jgi:hypothetical protein
VTSYRFRRRAFIAAMSGGVGLKIMLRNLESSAQGSRSPGRLLVTHWPVGIVAGQNDALWKPTSGSVGGSPALKPFADAGLGSDMTVIKGLTTSHLNVTGGGGHQTGTVTLVTGRSPGGTRTNARQGDDSFAAPGGSFDQILRMNVPALQGRLWYANSIVDSRTDVGEISTKTLSYSTQSQSVATYSGTVATEAIPLRPELSPLTQYMNLFQSMIPGNPGTGGSAGTGGAGGGAPPRVADAMLKKLVGRRSVLDFAREELNQVSRLAPTDARNKLRIHTDAVLSAEASIVNAINSAYPNTGGAGGTGAGGGGGTGAGGPACACATTPGPPPPASVMGKADPPGGAGYPYGNPAATEDDAPVHAQAGSAHLNILKAAFICDLIRVGTFQWSPGTNHVAFKGLYPNEPNAIYMHHPLSHRINTVDTVAAATLEALNPVAQFLFNVQSWYFLRHAENFAGWKNAVDGCGNNLLDFTCVPFLTEVRATSHERASMAAMIIGGKKLGFIHDRYVAASITINQLWGTIAQAFGYASTDAPFAPPVDGFWAKPT